VSIDRAAIKLWSLIKQHLPKNPLVLEIGEANWFGDIAIHEVEDWRDLKGIDTRDLFATARLFYQRVLNYRGIDSIDAGGPGKFTYRIDLNEPIEQLPSLSRHYDIVINTGTTEHVFDQRQVLTTIHDRCAVGGIMVHAFPVEGCMDHGFYNYQPNLLNAIATANGYLHLAAVVSEDKENGDKIIHLAWRKTSARAFVVPQQGRYAGVNGGGYIPIDPEKVPHSTIAKKFYKIGEKTMSGITKEQLLKEQAALEGQATQAREGIAAADRVRLANVMNLNATEGALQMTTHLLRKIETDERKQAEEAEELRDGKEVKEVKEEDFGTALT
jgi:hypothetical protein